MRKDYEIKLEEIKRFIMTNTTASVNELAELINVSPESTRKYLTYLEDCGFLYRTHGGAILRNNTNDIPMDFRNQEKQDIKYEICTEVIKFIKNGDLIFVDPSSTAIPLAKLMRLRNNVTIVTNSIKFIEEIDTSKNNVIFLGGNYSSEGKRCYSYQHIEMINKMNFDVSVMGTDGFKELDGPGTHDKEAVSLNEAVLKRTENNILITISSKFELKTHYQYAKFDDFQYLISNNISKERKNKIQEYGTIIIDVGESNQIRK